MESSVKIKSEVQDESHPSVYHAASRIKPESFLTADNYALINCDLPSTSTFTAQKAGPTQKSKKTAKISKQKEQDRGSGLNQYNKKKLLAHFNKFGFSPKGLNTVIQNPKDEVFEYLKQHVESSARHVYEDGPNQELHKLERWLNQFEEWNMDQTEGYQLAMLMRAIAENEDHPRPSELDGVDLQSIYRFISYGMLGLPQPKLSPKSAEFLNQEYDNLIESCQEEIKHLQNKYRFEKSGYTVVSKVRERAARLLKELYDGNEVPIEMESNCREFTNPIRRNTTEHAEPQECNTDYSEMRHWLDGEEEIETELSTNTSHHRVAEGDSALEADAILEWKRNILENELNMSQY